MINHSSGVVYLNLKLKIMTTISNCRNNFTKDLKKNTVCVRIREEIFTLKKEAKFLNEWK
jgi:hypothetical protein